MGIDILDICFRLEKRFKIRLRGQFNTLFEKRTPPDATAGEVQDFVLKVIGSPAAPSDGEAPIEQDLTCMNCGYNLRGLKRSGACPECGASAGYEDQIWVGVRNVLVDSLGVNEDEVHRDSLLIRDLGAG